MQYSGLKVTIGDAEVEVEKPEDLPVSINYALEDAENFRVKPSSTSLSLRIPATLLNEQAANTFRNAAIEDMTTGKVFRGHQKCTIEANGYELLVGKAFLTSAVHNDRPQQYDFNLYGDNADWLIDLQESTLHDFLKHIIITFSTQNIIDSWVFNGRDENLPYVFAPVRLATPFEDAPANFVQLNPPIIKDINFRAVDMRPSSVYFLIYWALKSVGYRISSTFLDSEYFRRQVMPWTWGAFLDSENTAVDIHRFLAKGTERIYAKKNHAGYLDLKPTANPALANGVFDNNFPKSFSYDATAKEMKWTYQPNQNFGPLKARFSCQLDLESKASWNSDAHLQVEWYKNGVLVGKPDVLVDINAPVIGGGSPRIGIRTSFFEAEVIAGDIVSCKVDTHIFDSKTGTASIFVELLRFQVDSFAVPIGGFVNFSFLAGFKNYKWIDFFAGIVDLYNLSFNTDPINKVVYIEPTHPYSLNHALNTVNGYFSNDHVDWNGKEDLSKLWQMDNYSEYEREIFFNFKEDSNDGILKTIQDRHATVLGCAKFVFPERFKAGKKNLTNRFFSPLMHFDVEQWKGITGIAPQMPCLVPENISNTSSGEAANTFSPKIAYYKGNVAGAGGWRYNHSFYQTFPFMFSVNYKDNGQNDPILSYSDEKISNGNGYVVGKGLLKRFYWQRLAIMRNGQWYNAWFRLRNVDVAGMLHREYISYEGQRWELVLIKDYKPLQEGSTQCLLRKWAPISQEDFVSTFPTAISVIDGNTPNTYDVKYAPLKCLKNDIPS